MSDSQFLEDKIHNRWIQTFMMNHDLVIRSQWGQLAVSPEKQLEIKKRSGVSLGRAKKGI